MSDVVRINSVVGLGNFLRGLHTREPWPDEFSPPSGDPRSRISAMVPPTAPNFPDFLELGIRRLVLALVAGWSCTTFTSCAGHPAASGMPAAAATVGILPLDDAEYRRISLRTSRFREDVASRFASAVITTVRCDVEFSTAATSFGDLPVIELWFRPVSADVDRPDPAAWQRYFTQLDPAVALAVECV